VPTGIDGHVYLGNIMDNSGGIAYSIPGFLRETFDLLNVPNHRISFHLPETLAHKLLGCKLAESIALTARAGSETASSGNFYDCPKVERLWR
jgi:hypothetical protein